jgi:hypothetical protein
MGISGDVAILFYMPSRRSAMGLAMIAAEMAAALGW